MTLLRRTWPYWLVYLYTVLAILVTGAFWVPRRRLPQKRLVKSPTAFTATEKTTSSRLVKATWAI